MQRRTLSFRTAVVTALLALGAGLTATLPQSALAEGSGNDYCQSQCNDILPPGENGNATLADILGNRLFGTHPPHTDDQLGPYGALAGGYQRLTDATLGD